MSHVSRAFCDAAVHCRIRHAGMDKADYRNLHEGGQLRCIKDYGRLIREKENGDVFYVFVVGITDEKQDA